MPPLKAGKCVDTPNPSALGYRFLFSDFRNLFLLFPCAACTSFIDVVVVCDESNSIYPWVAVKNFLEKFVQGLDIGPSKTQVRTSITHAFLRGFLLEKALLGVKSSSLHLPDPRLTALNADLESEMQLVLLALFCASLRPLLVFELGSCF